MSALQKKSLQLVIALAVAFFGPFVLPPHVVGVYIPLGSFLFREEVWRAEPDSAFYSVFFIELTVYSGLLYSLLRLGSRLLKRHDSNDGD